MTSRPRLLLIAPYFFPKHYGGAVQIYDGLLQRMTGWDITVLSERGRATPEELDAFDTQAPTQHGYRVVRLPRLVLHFTAKTPIGRILEMFRFFGEVKRGFKALLAELQPDVVICGATFSMGWMMRHVPPGIARVNYIHGEELTLRRSGGALDQRHIKAQEWTLAHTDLNLVVSQYSADTVQKFPGVDPKKIALLPNAVDTQRFHPPTDREDERRKLNWADKTVLLTIARLIPRKGVDQVLRALAQQAQAGNLPANWIYCIGGNGPEKPRLLELAVELGIEQRVNFLGFIRNEDLAMFYGAADLFVLTNREIDGDTEGFGIVFIEANACGTAVIGGIAGGTAEAIADGISGLRVDGDNVAAVGAALSKLSGDIPQRERMAREGLDRVRNGFDLDERAKQLGSLLANLIPKR